MLELEDRILQARRAPVCNLQAVLDQAVADHMARLPSAAYPGAADLAAAVDSAQATLKEKLLTAETLAPLTAEPVTDETVAMLRLSVTPLAGDLAVPPPQDASQLSPLRLGLAALIGAFAGGFLLTPLMHWLLDMRDMGMLLGPPLGAFLLVLGMWRAAQSPWLRRTLIAVFGVAAVGEVWQMFTGGGILGRLWRRLAGRHSASKRIVIYVCVIGILLLAKREPRYDRAGYQQTVRAALAGWAERLLDLAVILLAVREAPSTPPGDADALLYQLAGRVRSLQRVPAENINIAIEELITELTNMGFAGESALSLTWSEELAERYQTFGHIDPGDEVVVEREPVRFQGAIREKGLVRKIRKGT